MKLLLPLLAVIATLPAVVDDSEQFCNERSYVIAADEVRSEDLYAISQSIDVLGRQEGDLVGFAQTVSIPGEVTGDVILGHQSLDISGRVGDTVRSFGDTLNITGTVDGDVIFLGGKIYVHPQAHITGNLIAFCGGMFQNGRVDGDLRLAGGQISMAGTVGGHADIETDTIHLRPGARIEGDLTYTSRKKLQLDDPGIVGGSIVFEEEKDQAEEDEADEPFLTIGGFLWWGWGALAAVLVGWVAVAVFRRATERIAEPVGRETMLGALIGFGVFLVVPAASVLAMVLVLTLPLGVLLLLLFTVALYLAKMPVAIWLGSWILERIGGTQPSPFLALPVGILILYVLFEVPYVGFLLWLLTTFLGLGSMILAGRGYLNGGTQTEQPATAD